MALIFAQKTVFTLRKWDKSAAIQELFSFLRIGSKQEEIQFKRYCIKQYIFLKYFRIGSRVLHGFGLVGQKMQPNCDQKSIL